MIKTCVIHNNRAYCEEAEFKFKAPNGWYRIDILKRKLDGIMHFPEILQIKPSVSFYEVEGKFIPLSFDVAKRKNVPTEVLGQNFQPMNIMIADAKLFRGKCFYIRNRMPKTAFRLSIADIDTGKKLERRKGLTPEDIYTIGCYAMIVAQKEAEIAEQDIENRVKKAFSVSGAKLIEYVKVAKDKVDIIWEFLGEKFRSTVFEKSLSVFHAGICLAGADKKHNLSSLPFMARTAIESDELYKTAEVSND